MAGRQGIYTRRMVVVSGVTVAEVSGRVKGGDTSELIVVVIVLSPRKNLTPDKMSDNTSIWVKAK